MNGLKFISVIILCSWLNNATAQIIPDISQPLLQSYIDTALKNNPGINSYQFESEAMQQKVNAANSWDDPMLYGGVMNLPVNFSFTQDMMTMKQVGIQQNFTVGKKYDLKKNVAQKEFDVSVNTVQMQRLLLINELKQLYYDLYAQQKTIETTRSSIEAMKSYANIANARYSTGLGSQQDILKAQLDLTKLDDELIKLQSKKKDLTATFNSILNRTMDEEINVPDEIKFREYNFDMDSLMTLAQNNNPAFIQAINTVSLDSTNYLLAKASKIPDFNANIWYGQRDGFEVDGAKRLDMVGLTFGITLPVFSKRKQNPLIASANTSIQKSQYKVEATQNQIGLMMHHAIIDAEKNKQLITLYEKQLLPQAEQNVSIGIIGYQENKIDFLTLTDNFLSLYNYRLQYYQSIADYMKAIAQLEMLTGKSIN